MLKNALLCLESGRTFSGFCPENQFETTYGEVVFSTGMTGYVESLTDPSYAGQILCFTYPLIGNYGVPNKALWESEKIHAKGVIVSSPTIKASHRESEKDFLSWLHKQNVPVIWGIDTRALTKVLREKGSSLGAIGLKKVSFVEKPFDQKNLIASVSTKKPYDVGKGKKTLIAVDCGMKKNILRSLVKMGFHVRVVPFDYDYTKEPYDGLFLSNGPGNPEDAEKTLSILRKALLLDKPIFGICLGSQLLAIASGAKTYKLPFGHRSQNQPCLDIEKNRCILTSQNHGFAIDEATLSSDWTVSFTNVNDGSVEGISHREKPFFAVQFHPESCPGPNDARYLFERFYEIL